MNRSLAIGTGIGFMVYILLCIMALKLSDSFGITVDGDMGMVGYIRAWIFVIGVGFVPAAIIAREKYNEYQEKPALSFLIGAAHPLLLLTIVFILLRLAVGAEQTGMMTTLGAGYVCNFFVLGWFAYRHFPKE
ncbi:MAG: hypothetical protein ACK4NC_05495 [Candidatus Gracilibacteria bacterium]